MMDLNELADEFASGNLTIDGVYRTVLPGGQTYKGHTKDNPTRRAGFVFAMRGSGTFIFEGCPYQLIPGKLVHGGKGMELGLQIGESGLEYFLIQYTLKTAEFKDSRMLDTHFGLDTGESPAIVELLQLLLDAASEPGSFAALRMKELFYSILHEVLTSSRNRLNQESKTVVKHALEYVHNHYKEQLTLAALAQMHDMDVKPFAYLFTKYAGISPIDYLIQYRMKRAKLLLVGSGCSVRDIAESVGYEDAHYFSRLFKKHIGNSPSEFRASAGNYPPPIE
jgi:AraC-like DNA-binding protein